MTHTEKRRFLLRSLLDEEPRFERIDIPDSETEQKRLLRSLFNIRLPHPVSATFLQIQDEYLREEIAQKGITDFSDLSPIQEDLYLWQGDITTLRVDAIVNAANSGLLGCFYPCHGCIDNAIHTYAGVQLRQACAELMKKQGRDEPPGMAKITPAFNLPSKFVLHTVGPIVSGEPDDEDCRLLASCYRSCLAVAEKNGLRSLAFCCISTGEFHFPNVLAAEIAVGTVKTYKETHHSRIKVIFNVFTERDDTIYRRLLGAN